MPCIIQSPLWLLRLPPGPGPPFRDPGAFTPVTRIFFLSPRACSDPFSSFIQFLFFKPVPPPSKSTFLLSSFMYKSIACIGFVACISAAIGASFALVTTTSSIVTPFLYPGHSLLCVPQVTQLAAVQDFPMASVSHLAVTSSTWLPCHSVRESDEAADSADSSASATPSLSAGRLNTSGAAATDGKSLVSPSDVAAVGRTFLTLLASNVQFLAVMNRISVSLVPSRSSVLVCAPVASFDSGSRSASFGVQPLPLQGFQCAIFNSRRSRQLLNGRNESTALLLYRAPIIIGTSLPPSMHLTSAPTTLLVSLQNDALVSASLVSVSPQMTFYMTGSTCTTFIFLPVFILISSAAASGAASQSTPRFFVAISVQLGPIAATCLAMCALGISILLKLKFLSQICLPPSFCRRIRSHLTTRRHALGACTAFAACVFTMPFRVTAQVDECCRNVSK